MDAKPRGILHLQKFVCRTITIYFNPENDIVVAVASYFKPTIFVRVDFIQKYIEYFIGEI